MGGANGQGLASSSDAVLDTLREGEQQQALGSVVVAIAAMLLAWDWLKVEGGKKRYPPTAGIKSRVQCLF